MRREGTWIGRRLRRGINAAGSGASEGGRGRRGPAEEGEAGAGRRRRAAVGREGEWEGRRDSVTLPKGVCAVRTCKEKSGLPPRASCTLVLEHVQVTAGRRRRCTSHCWEEEGECTRTCVCNECGRAGLRTLPAFSAARALRRSRSSLLPALASVGGDGARAEDGRGGGGLRTLPARRAGRSVRARARRARPPTCCAHA